MIIGNRVVNITVDEGGVPPHIKPLVASIVAVIEGGDWGEVTRNTCTVQELEESQDVLEKALEEVEAELQDVKRAARDLAVEAINFCKSAEVVAVSMTLKKAYEAGSASLELLEQIEEVETSFVIAVEKLKTYALRKQTEL